MLRGDASGRIPFALVAVLLLLSAGMSALYVAKLDRDESHARMQEARFAAMVTVADDVHREVLGQAQYVGLRAIGVGIDGLVNETKVTQAFDTGFREYVASRFPRVVRGVAVSVSEARGDLVLVQRRIVDQVPSNASRVEVVEGVRIETPDLDAPDATAPVDRLAYFEVHGLVNYTLALDGVAIHEPRALTTLVPLPAPFMEAKLTQATRSGTGDLTGVGRTVKAILASVVQFRVLDGMASLMRPATTTQDLLTPSDVELAVNLALLLEEVRRFHTYDRDAANAIDAAHAPPSVPDGFLPATQDRTLVRLLDRYAASGTLDAVDLYALYMGLDARGLSLASLFAQAIAALQDDAALRTLDYFGLTPLLDWINAFAEQLANWVDGFWRWATGEPSKEVEYMHGYVQAVFTDTGVGTSFFGPQRVALPDRSYAIGNGSGTLTITVPAHIATVPFRTLDLLGKECDSLWQAYFPNLKSRVGAVDSSLRNMVNDIATRIAKDAVVSGLLPASATGPLDPKDNVSLLDALGERVGKAVDDALAYFLESPQAVDTLMSNLWNATKALLGDLVDTLVGSYDAVVLAPLQEGFAEDALADDLMAAATGDPDYASLNLTQYLELRGAIDSDVVHNAWNRTAYEDRKATDRARWRLALALADGTSQPGAHLRAQIRAEVVGAGGWLWLAGNSVKRLVLEAAHGQDLGAGRAIYATQVEPFVVQDPRTPGSNATEAFRVAHSPAYVSLVPEVSGGVGRVGETHVAIVDPADLPPTDDTPNAHFTKFGASSQRPFTTQWTVRVSGTIRLRVETASPILLGPRGLEPAALEEAWPLDFTISFAAYSGWNLTGVRYRPSDTLFSDIVKFLDGALETVFPILRWVLDFFRKGLEILRDLVERISDFATRVVREIGTLFSRLVDILHELAMQALSIVGAVLDFVRAYLPANLRFSLYVSGIGLDVLANGPSGRALVLGFNLLGRGQITFLRLEDSEYRGRANGATYDVLGAWNAAVGALHQDGAFDPLVIVQPRMIQGSASWDRAWHADFAGPEFESRLLFDQSFGFTLFLPEGTEVGGKVGVEVLVAGNPLFDFDAALQRSVAEGFEEVGLPRSWQDIGRLVAAIARHVKANVLDQVEATIPEMGAYVQLDAAEVGAGGGVRLSVVADGHSTRLIVQWIADNAISYFERGFNPLAILDLAPPPRELLEHTWLRFDAFSSLATPDFLVNWGLEAELRVAARIEPNFAALGRLLGRDWGAPVVQFGLLVDGRVKLSWLGAYDVLYLLRGSVAFE